MNAQTKFSEYVESVGGRAVAAERLGVTVGMVGHVLNGIRSLSVEKSKLIEQQTGGAITRADLRPDIFDPAPDKSEAA